MGILDVLRSMATPPRKRQMFGGQDGNMGLNNGFDPDANAPKPLFATPPSMSAPVDVVPTALKTGATAPPVRRAESDDSQMVASIGAASAAFMNLVNQANKKPDGGEPDGAAKGTKPPEDNTPAAAVAGPAPSNNPPSEAPVNAETTVPIIKPAVSNPDTAQEQFEREVQSVRYKYDVNYPGTPPFREPNVSPEAQAEARRRYALDGVFSSNPAFSPSPQYAQRPADSQQSIDGGTGPADGTRYLVNPGDEPLTGGDTVPEKKKVKLSDTVDAEWDGDKRVWTVGGKTYTDLNAAATASGIKDFKLDQAGVQTLNGMGMNSDGSPINVNTLKTEKAAQGKTIGGITAFTRNDGSQVFVDREGNWVNPTSLSGETQKRLTQKKAATEDWYTGAAAPGTVNIAELRPVADPTTGQTTVVAAKAFQDEDGKWVLASKNINGLNGKKSERMLSDQEAIDYAKKNGTTLGRYNSEAEATAAIASLNSKATSGDVSFETKDAYDAAQANTLEAKPFNKEVDKVLEYGNEKVFVRNGVAYNVPKKGKPATINQDATNDQALLGRAATLQRIAQLPPGLERSRAEASFYREEAQRLETEKPKDKTHNFWDVLRAAGFGALKGFMTGGLGGAIGGGLAGAVGGAIDKTFDQKLRRQMFEIPDAQRKAAAATDQAAQYQGYRKADQEAREKEVEIGTKQLTAIKTGNEMADKIIGDDPYMKEIQGGKAGRLTKAKLDEMNERIRRRLRESGLSTTFTNPFKEGEIHAPLKYQFNSEGLLTYAPAEGEGAGNFEPVMQTLNGKQYRVLRESEAEGEFRISLQGSDGKIGPEFVVKGKEKDLGPQITAILSKNAGFDESAQKANQDAVNQSLNAQATEFNTRDRAIASLQVDFAKAKAANAPNVAEKEAKYNAASSSYTDAKQKYEEAMRDAKDETKSGNTRNKAMADAKDYWNKMQEFQAAMAANIVVDADGNPIVKGMSAEDAKKAIELLRRPPKTYEPVLIKAPVLRMQQGNGPDPVAPGTNYKQPTNGELPSDSPTSMNRRRPRRGTESSTSA